jgi:hypothetical protein
LDTRSLSKNLCPRQIVLLTAKIFDQEKHLANNYVARENLKPLVPDIHKIFKTEYGFDKEIMEIEMKVGKL